MEHSKIPFYCLLIFILMNVSERAKSVRARIIVTDCAVKAIPSCNLFNGIQSSVLCHLTENSIKIPLIGFVRAVNNKNAARSMITLHF